jgi:hypothetical protein
MKNLEVGVCLRRYCNTCKGETNHELKSIHTRPLQELINEGGPHEQVVFWEEFQYRFWICKGCDTALLEEAYTSMGMLNPEEDSYIYDCTLYPKRIRSDFPYKNFSRLKPELMKIYKEVISSFNNELNILCAIGLRCLLEGVCAEKGLAEKNLYQKIDGLKNYLPSNIVDNLHSFRFMGNDAAHELQAPQRAELSLAIEIIEDLLNFLYDLEYKTQKLPKRS